MSPKDFILKYRPFALTTQEKTGISHLFILAQAALETGWGTHAPGNMFFGIKAPKNTPEHVLRSEERRVGKECRSRWSPYH